MNKKAILACMTLAGGLVSTSLLAEISVKDAWVRLLPPSVTTTAGYMTLSSDRPDRLTGVSSPAAAMVEIHESRMENGTMHMEEVNGLDLMPAQPRQLKPGGYHLMIMGLKQPLTKDTRLPLTLLFEQAGEITLQAEIR